jgi:hypothetical protein
MKKNFDCVKFQDDAALRIYEEIKDFTLEQKVEYWKRKSEEALRQHQEMMKLSSTRSHPTPAGRMRARAIKRKA